MARRRGNGGEDAGQTGVLPQVGDEVVGDVPVVCSGGIGPLPPDVPVPQCFEGRHGGTGGCDPAAGHWNHTSGAEPGGSGNDVAGEFSAD